MEALKLIEELVILFTFGSLGFLITAVSYLIIKLINNEKTN